jgi:hypothetical protein
MVAAIIVTGVALFQWAGRLRLMGVQVMELGAANSRARNLNTGLAVFLWLVWAYLRG